MGALVMVDHWGSPELKNNKITINFKLRLQLTCNFDPQNIFSVIAKHLLHNVSELMQVKVIEKNRKTSPTFVHKSVGIPLFVPCMTSHFYS